MSLEIADESTIKKPWSLGRRITTAGVSLLVGAIIFALAYSGMHYHTGIGSYDQPVLNWMVHHRDNYVTGVMKVLTTLASPVVFAAIISLGAIAWALVRRKLWRPFLLVGAVGASAIISTVLKDVFKHARPPHAMMVQPFEIDFSFPSGHTIAMATVVLVLGYLMCSRNTSPGKIFSWIFIAVLGIGLVACSRLYLGYHWLTDVTASLGLGFIILAVVIAIDVVFTKRFKNLE